ncbi:peptidase M61 domain protein [Chloroherpeton thalassium ATCC 35110]|uniref:Peptidase M61 domain protein n=1 Tax=Chloroherpeton thalassium (strain ATCC 35110 / GB-78) TaxID=517418 RepID=B3QUT0_CHLT3|nr:PDZ domain-containing protein [Chloroherpeton thalassium]ACF14431.1 peptidase M61 domain protein [Chloroherpeton thalassium ATCC 35110]
MSASIQTPSSISTKHAFEKSPTRYRVRIVRENLHLIEVTVSLPTQQRAQIDFKLPAWRPGRYSIQNYAAHVQEFSAFCNNKNLRFNKLDKQTWRVYTEGEASISVKYRFYAAGPVDAGNCYIGHDKLFFTGSNLLVYTDDFRFLPATLTLQLPPTWKTATQLVKTDDPYVFYAETYDELIDAPILSSPTLANYPITAQGKTVNIFFDKPIAPSDKKFTLSQIQADLEKIVVSQFELMQDAPFGEYGFIYQILPERFYHGVEHKNSCSIVLGPEREMNELYDEFLSITSHEFFHVWNVKRILPDEFVPYDYTKEVYTPSLYICEGFTSYYGDLMLCRSGLWSPDTYFAELSKAINSVQSTYGRKVQSLANSSFDAWLTGYKAGRSTNSINFYTKGQLVALLLDLEIRVRTQNTASLDDVMRALNENFAKQNKGFSHDEFVALVEKIGNASFQTFFEKYVFGAEELPYEQSLNQVGLALHATAQPYMGVRTQVRGNLEEIQAVIPESPAALAGLDQGDILLAINNLSLVGASLKDILMKVNAGEMVTVLYVRGGKIEQATVTLQSQNTFKVVRLAQPKDTQTRLYESWLKQTWENS